ncbi:MAG TPA: L,D-transpeptidase family protein [Steroidobacteraceae bacterium]|jgi:murein L,D-transpeptidase YcbB/YkuD
MRGKLDSKFTAVALIISCVFFAPAWSPADAQPQADSRASAIEQQVATAAQSGASQIRGIPVAWPDLMLDFYQRRQFEPAWTRVDTVTQFLRALEESRDDGLDPADYNLTVLSELRADVAEATATVQLRAEFDLLLTDALARILYQVSFGKVDPASFIAQWNYGRVIDGVDAADVLAQMIESADIRERIDAAKPSHPLYQGLKRELARYREIERAGGWPLVPPGPTLKLGMTDARIPVLRSRLIASGDLASEAVSDSSLYDEMVVQGVTHFQASVGLEPDAVVGPGTLEELNVSASKRIDTLLVNLDRGRVLLHDLPAEFVVVNVAGFWVYLIRNGELIWQARAQVGTPYRSTPIFRSLITYLVFNPTWTVPPEIIRNDILPAARRDPDSIRRKGLDVVDRNGRLVEPESVDWSAFRSGHIPYTLVQQPGPNNALGRVKFMFPNSYAVYLHDTPSKSRFEESARAFSSGCVRVERPFELAALLLDQPDRWNAQSIERVIQAGKLQNVSLTRKIPVLLTYWTAWVDREGRVSFRRDIYQQDSPWLAGLKRKFTVRQRPLSTAQQRNGRLMLTVT